MLPTATAPLARVERRDVAIASKHLEALKPILASGRPFDLLHEFRERWNSAWQEALDSNINPSAVGRNLVAAYFATVSGEPPNYGQAGKLVNKYGKLALLGIDEGLIANADDPYRYAFRVCQNQAAAHRAQEPA